MYREVNKFSHFKKESGLYAEMVEFRKWERLPMEMCSRAPGTWFRPSSVFFLTSLFCLNTLPPHSFQKVLNSNALDEKRACLLPTYIWPGPVLGLKGTNPEMHVYPPPRVEMPTLLTVTVEEQGRGRKEREEKGGGGGGRRRGAAPQAQLQTQAHMSHSPFLLLQETKSVCCLLLGQPSAHPRPQGPRESSC